METLHHEGYSIFLEIGAKPILLGMGRPCFPENIGVWLPSLRPGYSDWQQMLSSLAQLYVQGVKIDWSGFDKDYNHHKVVLPTYPFQRQRYWIETDTNLVDSKTLLPSYDHLHPLLGQRLYFAGLKEQISFECQINTCQPTYLKDHCVFSKSVFPAAAYLEIALAAGAVLFNSDNLILENVVIQQALILPEDKTKTIQIVLARQKAQTYNFEIFSRDFSSGSEPIWTLHVEGELLSGNSNDIEPESTNLKKIQEEYNQQRSSQDFYQEFQDRGIDYGFSFQAVKQVWQSEGKSLAQIELPEALVAQTTKYQLHPVLLDASFQALLAALNQTEDRSIYLPVNIKRLQVYDSNRNYLWAQAKINEAKTKTLTGEVSLLDEQGTLIAQVEGVNLLRTSPQSLLSTIEADINNWLYQIHWEHQVISPSLRPVELTESGSWLIFADSKGIGEHLAQSLTKQDQCCILVRPGESYQRLEPQHYQLNPIIGSEFPRLLEESLAHQPPLRGIIHLWSLEEITALSTSPQELLKHQELGCGSVLHLVQSLVKNRDFKSAPLLLVTQGSQPVGNESVPLQFQQSSLWGLHIGSCNADV